jgi:hypothetical protein
MKKRILVIGICALLLCTVCFGTTFALLMFRAHPLNNTFVVGDISLTLTESTGSAYTLVPGSVITKDPRITVGAGSEECWVFIKIDCEDELTPLITYTITNGWTALASEEGVYWRRVSAPSADVSYGILANDRITVSQAATEEALASFVHDPKLTFYAYAIQHEGISTAERAWQTIQARRNEA